MKKKQLALNGSPMAAAPPHLGTVYGLETDKIPVGPGLIAPITILDFSTAGFEYFCDSYYGGNPVKGASGKTPGWKTLANGHWLATDSLIAAKTFVAATSDKDGCCDVLTITERAAKELARLGCIVRLRRERTVIFSRTTVYERTICGTDDATRLESDEHKTEDVKRGIWR